MNIEPILRWRAGAPTLRFSAFILLVVAWAMPLQAQQFSWANFAGLPPGGPGSVDATGNAARFNFPYGAAAYFGSGDVYVADQASHTIRRITSAGVVTTLAGLVGSSGSADGTGSAARFNNPTGVAVGLGGIYVADRDNHTIRRVTTAGVVTTLAGLAGSSGSADGLFSAARFNNPTGVAVDNFNNDTVYVADSRNYTIRKVVFGTVTTLAGSAGNSGSADGTGSAARFGAFTSGSFTANPTGVAVDTVGNVYVADQANSTIRKITGAGVVTTLAGLAGSRGSTDGTVGAARFYFPSGVSADGTGNVYVADPFAKTIRKISNAGVVTTLAGSALSRGSADGTGSVVRFASPTGLAADFSGNIYVADQDIHAIRKITGAGVVTTLAGPASNSGSTDGAGSAAQFNYPRGVAVDGSGNIYVADFRNSTIRKITSAGVVTTLAGLAGSVGSTDGTGSAARFNLPTGVAVDAGGNVYVAGNRTHTIRKITSAGVVTTLAGLADTIGSADGTGSAAGFNFPAGVAVDASGNVYVADYGDGLFNSNNTIRKITSAGVVTTIGGTVGFVGSADGTGSAAGFSGPFSIAVSNTGTLFVADSGNHRISLGLPVFVPPLLTVAATGGVTATGVALSGTVNPNGLATTAQFQYGPDISYGSSASVTLSPDSGTSAQNISAAISALSPGTLYHYRLTATNSAGPASTADSTFTTLTAQENWRQTYFGSTANSGNGADSADPDGDGFANLFEYVAGLDPTSAPSRFSISTASVPGQQTIIFGPIAAGRTYMVTSKASFSDPTWLPLTSFTTMDNGTQRTVTDLSATGAAKFYRVEITLP